MLPSMSVSRKVTVPPGSVERIRWAGIAAGAGADGGRHGDGTAGGGKEGGTVISCQAEGIGQQRYSVLAGYQAGASLQAVDAAATEASALSQFLLGEADRFPKTPQQAAEGRGRQPSLKLTPYPILQRVMARRDIARMIPHCQRLGLAMGTLGAPCQTTLRPPGLNAHVVCWMRMRMRA